MLFPDLKSKSFNLNFTLGISVSPTLNLKLTSLPSTTFFVMLRVIGWPSAPNTQASPLGQEYPLAIFVATTS